MKTLTTLQWILSRDTGLSSETIWGVMMGALPDPNFDRRPHVPRDLADFGRCFRLLQKFPDWRERLPEMATAYAEWGPFVREWGSLEADYAAEPVTRGSHRELNDRIMALAKKADAIARGEEVSR